MLFALAVAGSVLGPGILCGIAAIYDGYDHHRCLFRRVLRASAFVAVAFFATLLGLIAVECGAPPEVRWDWLALLVATTMAFTVSLLPGVATYLTVFHLSARLQAPVEPLPAPPPQVQETGNPYQPPAC